MRLAGLVGVPLVAIAVLLLLRGAGGPSGSATPGPTQAVVTPSPSATPDSDARAFTSTYLDYLYGRGSLASVRHVAESVRAQLPATLSLISARERAQPFRLAGLRVTESGGLATVVAQVAEGDPALGVATFPVTFTMQRGRDGWETSSLPALG